MANKIVAVFLMCIVLAAAISVQARKNPDEHVHVILRDEVTNRIPEKHGYRQCFGDCQENCPRLKGQYTECEMKCDSQCSEEEFVAKLRIKDMNDLD